MQCSLKGRHFAQNDSARKLWPHSTKADYMGCSNYFFVLKFLKGTIEISHKSSNPYTAKYEFYWYLCVWFTISLNCDVLVRRKAPERHGRVSLICNKTDTNERKYSQFLRYTCMCMSRGFEIFSFPNSAYAYAIYWCLYSLRMCRLVLITVT